LGRPAITLSEAQIAEVETLAAVLTAEQIADYFGIGRTTFFAMIQRDPSIAERYKRGRARAIGAVAQSLIAKARAGNVVAMIFFLKTQAGWRETAEVAVSLGEAREPGAGDAMALLRERLERIAERQRQLGLAPPDGDDTLPAAILVETEP
jgi:hypothetical protein